MSKTYRTIPDKEEIKTMISEKKIKKNDKKHQHIITTDGEYSHPCYDNIKGDGAKIGNNDLKEGKVTSKEKKIVKKVATKNQRNYNKNLTKKEND